MINEVVDNREIKDGAIKNGREPPLIEKNNKKEKKEIKIFEKVKTIPHYQALIAVICVVVLVLMYLSFVSSPKKEEETVSGVSLEIKIQEILTKIKGVGDANIFISYNGDEIIEIASKTEKHSNITTSDNGRITETVTQNKSPIIVGGNTPLVIGKKPAKIEGVIVVAKGGNNESIKMQIKQAIVTVLNVSSTKIQIYEMK